MADYWCDDGQDNVACALSDNPWYRKKQKLSVFLFFNYPFHYAPRKTEGQPQNGNYEFISPEKNTILEN